MAQLNPSQIANYSGKNYIINGDFQVAQRGTAFSNMGLDYCLDHWEVYGSAALLEVSQLNANVSLNSLSPGAEFYIRVTNSDVDDDGWRLRAPIENVWTLAEKTVTLSFIIQADDTLNMTCRLQRDFGSGGATTDEPWSTSLIADSTYTRYEYTFTMPGVYGNSIGGGNHLTLDWMVNDAVQSAFRLADVQFEEGSVATPFQRLSYGEQLALCQRFYQYIGNTANSATAEYMSFDVTSGSRYWKTIRLISPMRAVPTITMVNVNGLNFDVNSLTAETLSERSFRLYADANGTGRGYITCHWTADAEL